MRLFLYHGQTSTCSSKVRIVLAEKELEWTGKVLDLHKGEQFAPDYLKLNPNAVVPTLLADDRPVIESGLIMQLADEIGSGTPLMPDDLVEKARVRLWLKRIDDDLHPAVSTITYALAMRRNWLARSIGELREALDKLPSATVRANRRAIILDGLSAEPSLAALHGLKRYFSDLASTLASRRFVVGDSLSLADLGPLSYLHRLELLGFSWFWSELEGITSWYERMMERGSVRTGLTDWMREPDFRRLGGFEEEAMTSRLLVG